MPYWHQWAQLGSTLLASSSGAMVDGLGGNWGLFFIITALMVIPSLICLMLIKGKLNIPIKLANNFFN